MFIHEYQAKEIFRSYNINVSDGILALTPEEAREAAEKLGGGVVAVKAQVHAGGRGKAGGVKIAKDPSEAEALAKTILGMKLVSRQTGPEGKIVNKVYIEKGTGVEKEYYLSFSVDGAAGQIVIVASSEGGMDIEEVSEKHPEKIIKTYIDALIGYKSFIGYNIAGKLGIAEELKTQFAEMLASMYRLFLEKDCSLIEINPLALTSDNQLLALDAKINFDDAALYRHKELLSLWDPSEVTELEAIAHDMGLNYVSLDGNIGCVVGGAGMAMATMDAIKFYGGQPANFLDIGGKTSVDYFKNAFDLVTKDKRCVGIYVNCFGGITMVDRIAEGLILSAKEHDIDIPVVVRLVGNNQDRAEQLLNESGLPIKQAKTLSEGAEMIMSMVRGNQ